MAVKQVTVVCYDLNAISGFFRSAAVVMSLQQHTSLRWLSDDDDGLIEQIFSAVFGRTAYVGQDSHEAIERTTDLLHGSFLLTWVDVLHTKGPTAANDFVTEVAIRRARANQQLHDVFHNVASTNDARLEDAKDVVRTLAAIKLGATIGVTVIALTVAIVATGGAAGGIVILGMEAGASPAVFGGLAAGYSITSAVIKDWEKGPAAQAVAVSRESSKAAAGEGLGEAAKHGLEKALAKQGKAEQIISSAEGQIRKYSQRLAQNGLRVGQQRKATNIIGQSRNQIAKQTSIVADAAKTARLARIAGKGIPVIFAAWDVFDAFQEYNETMEQAR
jgi:hypothetical protein